MIRFATVHDLGRNRSSNSRNPRPWRHILKYFDPWMPLDPHSAEYVQWQRKPKIEELVETCLIEEKDVDLFHETPVRATSDMKCAVTGFMFEDREWYIWEDMCNDAGYLDCDVDKRKLVLFLFWHQKGIMWDRRLFLECSIPFTPRKSNRDETG